MKQKQAIVTRKRKAGRHHMVSACLLLSSIPHCFTAPLPALGNAILDRESNTARILYPVADKHATQRAVSYVLKGDKLKAVFPDGETKWTISIQGENLFGGFDFDGDGWIDLGSVVRKPTNDNRNGQQLQTRQILLFRGKSGEAITTAEPLTDLWWPKLGYSTVQWSHLSILFGSQTPLLSMAPYYAQEGFICAYENGKFRTNRFVYPSTPAYDKAYRNAKPDAYGQGRSHVENSHVNNGLFVQANGQDRLLFFTSSRVVQYAAAPFGPGQLVCDHPFLNGGREDLAGRNYGLVMIDPSVSSRVALVAGTHAQSVYTDLKTGKIEADPLGAIERHVTAYDFLSDTLDHRFYSSVHDKGGNYEQRVVYPCNIYIRGKPGQPSRLAYNVYENGRWQLHISKPGSTADQLALADLFLWDIIERNGQTQLIISPSEDPKQPDAIGHYFPKWRTDVYAWDERNRKLVSVESIDGAIPHLQAKFREGNRTTSYGWLYPALTVSENGKAKLLLERKDGKLFLGN